MSQENVEVVRSGYETFARGDMESLAAHFRKHFDPEFEYRSELAGESYKGVEGVLAFAAGVREAFQDYTTEIEEIVDAGEHVVVTSRQWGRGTGSGVPMEWRITVVWTFNDDGNAVRGKAFSVRSEALETVGMRE
jgi:ketosteroid isomerase-like protein